MDSITYIQSIENDTMFGIEMAKRLKEELSKDLGDCVEVQINPKDKLKKAGACFVVDTGAGGHIRSTTSPGVRLHKGDSVSAAICQRHCEDRYMGL